MHGADLWHGCWRHAGQFLAAWAPCCISVGMWWPMLPSHGPPHHPPPFASLHPASLPQKLCAEEHKKGIMGVDPALPSTITAFPPGYIDKDKEVGAMAFVVCGCLAVCGCLVLGSWGLWVLAKKVACHSAAIVPCCSVPPAAGLTRLQFRPPRPPPRPCPA